MQAKDFAYSHTLPGIPYHDSHLRVFLIGQLAHPNLTDYPVPSVVPYDSHERNFPVVVNMAIPRELFMGHIGHFPEKPHHERLLGRRFQEFVHERLVHLEAAGRFAWRCERGRSLFRASQAAVEHAWRRRHPALERLAPPARAAWIAERIGLAPRAVEAALYREAPEEGDFVRASAALQRLAAELEK